MPFSIKLLSKVKRDFLDALTSAEKQSQDYQSKLETMDGDMRGFVDDGLPLFFFVYGLFYIAVARVVFDFSLVLYRGGPFNNEPLSPKAATFGSYDKPGNTILVNSTQEATVNGS